MTQVTPPTPTTSRTTTSTESAGERRRRVVARAAQISAEVLTSVEAGQRSALGAVHQFVDTLDDALPASGKHPTRRDRVIGAALDLADRLVTTQYEFLRSVLQSVDRGAGGKPKAKKPGTTKPTAKKPTAKKPTAKKPTAKPTTKPTTKKPTTKKQVAKKSATRESAAKPEVSR